MLEVIDKGCVSESHPVPLLFVHDASTSALTTMAYHLAAHPKWQERCRDESARLGDEPLAVPAGRSALRIQ